MQSIDNGLEIVENAELFYAKPFLYNIGLGLY